MTIGDSIRAARKSRGLTQNELAHAMGITGSAIGQYECGVRTPKYETVERISSALSVPTSSLMPVVSSEIERLTARCARYAEEIAVAQERQRWIPVTERLPENFQKVLCWGEYFRYGDFNAMFADYAFGYQINGSWGGEVSNGTKARALAWMPLPEPPEVERWND